MSVGPAIVQPRPVQPDGVAWLGISAVLACILLLVAETALALRSGTISAGPEELGLLIMSILGYGIVGLLPAEASFILAIVYLATAAGLFRGKRWVWRLSMILSVVSIGLNLSSNMILGLFGLFGLPTLFVTFVIPYYLTRPYVRHYFQA